MMFFLAGPSGWYNAQTFFNYVFVGIDTYLGVPVEFGEFQKLGDPTSRKQVVFTTLIYDFLSLFFFFFFVI
jgi:hypothetical protein